jgi:hypothetical protein
MYVPEVIESTDYGYTVEPRLILDCATSTRVINKAQESGFIVWNV